MLLEVCNGQCEAVQLLSETLVCVDVRDSAGHTPLYLAAQKGSVSCVEVLLSHGASCCTREHAGKRTPLHGAGSTFRLISCLKVKKCCIFLATERPNLKKVFRKMLSNIRVTNQVAAQGSSKKKKEYGGLRLDLSH